MAKHGSESYFIEGEGLLTESGGGRDGEVPAALADAAVAAATPSFRFSRMGPKGTGRQLGEASDRAVIPW